MTDPRPGLNPSRLVRLMAEAVDRCGLDLNGAVVLTEAASGAYAVTPVLAAMAGAEVVAVTRSTRYGSAAEIARNTLDLARRANVRAGCLRIVEEKPADVMSRADIVTNSGHVRPIDAAMIDRLKPTAVIPLMYESWEYRAADVDLAACRRRGIAVAGTNERHPAVDVFSFLGVMAVRLLHEAGVAVYRSRVLVLCDNPFRSFIVSGLEGGGASVDVSTTVTGPLRDGYDAVLVANQPTEQPIVGLTEAKVIAERWPGAVVAQYWGDVDRDALVNVGVSFWPRESPGPGHMGVLPSAVGPEPIVRLQSGGLKVGELLWRARKCGATAGKSVEAAEQSGFGERVNGS
ncbi:MAG TPA: hypothetical protein VKD90_21730 [Gemmataceae bacterium]|nr:hypothetical protein [Gemmataceae bacterium]